MSIARESIITILETLGKEIERSEDPTDASIAGCLYALTFAIRNEITAELSHHVMIFTNEQIDRRKGSIN